MPLVLTGNVTFESAEVASAITCTTHPAALRFSDTIVTGLLTLTPDEADTASLEAHGSRFSGIIATNVNGTGFIHLSGTRLGKFHATNCEDIKATGLKVDAGTAAEAAIDFTDCTDVRIEGSVEALGRQAIRWEDVVIGVIDMLIKSSPNADNTYDAVSLEGVCDRTSIFGQITGAYPGANNPRYGIQVAAGCLATDIWAQITGAQTAAINDISTIATIH